MKCFCVENDAELVFCVVDVPASNADMVRHAWFIEDGEMYTKTYLKTAGVDHAWYRNRVDVERVKENFARLGAAMFSGRPDWQTAFRILAGRLWDANIEWYAFGSSCEAVRGINIVPNDIDVIVHTRDFYRVKEVFTDEVVEPFVDNKDTWLVRYFGRLCVAGTIVDVVADEKMDNENHPYEQVSWAGHAILVEPFHNRLALERQRDRPDRLAAMEAYLSSV